MKCPKCSYLGFESSDRCRHCGYDFSLSGGAPESPADLPLRPGAAASFETWSAAAPPRGGSAADPLAPLPLDTIVAAPAVPAPAAASAASSAPRPAAAAAPSLPLFQPEDDQPLVKLPAAPRPPLAVRRTPDRPRRVTPRAVRRPTLPESPVLPMIVEPAPAGTDGAVSAEAPRASARARTSPPAAPSAGPATLVPCGVGRRLGGAAIDHGLLLAIDAIVIYFTLKMAGLTAAEWWMLPPLPLASFLLLLKLAYFSAFTMVGGQTIGKMAVGIRVVGEDGSALEPARAVRRTLVGAVSALAAGAGLVPLIVGTDRRGFHDRVARTRVIALPSARHLV